MTNDDPRATQDDPRVTHGDLRSTKDDPRVTQENPRVTHLFSRESYDQVITRRDMCGSLFALFVLQPSCNPVVNGHHNFMSDYPLLAED